MSTDYFYFISKLKFVDDVTSEDFQEIFENK